jgi:hypothetical protein
MSIDLGAEVAAILRAHAAEARLSEGEIVDRAIRAYDLRSLIARFRERPRRAAGPAIAAQRVLGTLSGRGSRSGRGTLSGRTRGGSAGLALTGCVAACIRTSASL